VKTYAGLTAGQYAVKAYIGESVEGQDLLDRSKTHWASTVSTPLAAVVAAVTGGSTTSCVVVGNLRG
jgi:hypothetical protein